MIFETLAGAAAALSAVNSTIDVLKQSKANAQDVGKLLASFGEAAGKLDSYEAKTKKKRPLTPKEAMQLSLHRLLAIGKLLLIPESLRNAAEQSKYTQWIWGT